MICPVIFGPDDQYILGATSLETLGFVVDPIGEELMPVTPSRPTFLKSGGSIVRPDRLRSF